MSQSVVSKNAIRDAIRAFDAQKHAVLEESEEFQRAQDANAKFALVEQRVRALTAQYQNLVAMIEQPRASDCDASILGALEKRVINTRSQHGGWRGAQFGVELTEYWKLCDRIDDETVDERAGAAIVVGLQTLRDVCEKRETKFTFQQLLDSIEYELSDDEPAADK